MDAATPPGDPFGLAGRTCVVTGAGSGIGRGIAEALAGAGAKVAILDVDRAGAGETADRIGRTGGAARPVVCDVSDPDAVAAAAADVLSTFGPCDVLVNNAGLIRAGALETLAIADWNRLLSVNLTGYLICAQAFGRPMRERGRGAIVHVSSIASTHATAFSGAYSVAKAGVTMLSRQLSIEWGPAGIRSNVVHPGLILTPLSEGMYARPGVTEQRSAAVPRGRIGRPEDVAQAVLFLASDRADYVCGAEITVDGGFSRMLLSLIPRAGYERPAN